MQAEFEMVDGIMVIHLKGRLSYEWAGVFRLSCRQQLMRRQCAKIVFNLSQLSFVGSSGINEFLATITELSSKDSSQIKFCGVATEFQRIFQASPLKDIEIYENDKKARLSFQMNPQESLPRLRDPFLELPRCLKSFRRNLLASLHSRSE